MSVAIVSVNTAPAVSKMVTGEAHYDSQLNTSTGIANDTQSRHPLLKNGLFEGDLKISEEFIRKFYNLSSILELGKTPNSNETVVDSDKKLFSENGRNILRNQRAAVRDYMLLW